MGGGGKGSAPTDNSMMIYQMQQQQLAQQKADDEAKAQAAAQAEADQREALRKQMLGQRDVMADTTDDSAIQKTTLG